MNIKSVVVGMDIGGTNSVFGLVDENGAILAENSLPTRNFPTAESFVSEISVEIRNLVKSQPNILLEGLGIGAPNGNYYNGCIEMAPNLQWKGIVPLARLFEDELHVKTVLTNDANAAALGEMIFGGAKYLRDFIVVTLGTGLGSGFVINGELVYGHDGFAGELGHVTIIPGGRICGCGRKGCLEAYVSATGIVISAKEKLAETSIPSSLRNVKTDHITSQLIAQHAEDGDKLALEILDYTAHLLGASLANTVAIVSPKKIFLFGGLAKAGELILAPTKKYMEENLLNIFKDKVEILPSAITDNVAILGASALIWKELRI